MKANQPMHAHYPVTRRCPLFIAALCTLAGLVSVHATPPTTQPIAGQGATSAPGPLTEAAHYWLRVTDDQVNLRSRADRNSLSVARLDRDEVLQAVGSEYGWHRVLPPEGVFSFVSGRYVDRTSDEEGVVAVSSGDLRVRVGSLLTEVDPLQTEVQRLLPRGTKVRIIGERDEWLKIVPPDGVFFYVFDEQVERVTPEQANAWLARAGRPARATAGSGTASRPVEGPDLTGPWGQRLLLSEAAIEAESRKDVLQQSWTASIAELRPIAEQRSDPAVAQLAQRWITRLEERIADQAALRAARQVAGQGERTQAQLEREMEQVHRARQHAASQPDLIARGQLRQSFAMRGGQSPPFRLVDPITGNVIAYIEVPLDSKLRPAEYLGLYVGVAGERRSDETFGADIITVKRIEVIMPKRP